MLEDWILSKLRPLTGAPLIILRDPQRMIQPGAMAVDGWAEAHQYAAPFCYGNLSLRDMVEGIRDDPHTRLLLVDRSREDARVPLFYPDLSVEAGPDCQLTLTLRDCLVETTGDAHWPQKVNERLLSALILEHLPGVLQAHRQLREVDDSRFTDSDLDKIVMGAMLGINPFRRLTVSEIRRLCVEQHTAVAKLAGTISDEVTGGVYQMIGTAPKPFCWLLDRDPTWVIRAFTLAAILHQHKLDYDLLLSNLAPELHGYRGIEASFLDEALQDQLRADPDRVLEDVRDTETFLVEQPERLALLMRDSLHLDDARAARQALRREKLSPLVRSLALLSLLADLLIHRKLGAHKRILRELMEQEQDPGLMALRRPSESWEALRTAYKRAIEVLDQGSTLGKVTKDLQALDEGALTLAHFHELWNAKQLNRLDYYISDLDRMLRLGNNMLPLAVQDMWPELRERWEKTRPALQSTIQRWIDPWQNEVDALFQDLCRREYGNWIHQEDAPAIFTHQFLRRLVQPHWDPRSGRKAVILIFDGLRTDAWEEIVRPVLEERFDVMEERPGCALLPTETQLSRKAIAAGCLPEAFSSTKESALLENWLQEHLRLNVRLEVVKDDDTIASGMSIRYTSPQVEYIVFDFADNNLHHNNQDLAFIYDSTMRRIMQEDVRSVLRELPADALLFITSDHGISPSPSAWVPIPDEVLADVRDCKYRNARAQGNLREEHASKVIDLDARRLGLKGSPALVGEDFSHLLFPRPGYGFRRPGTGYNPDKYSHGGMTLAECLVPMIVMGPKLHDQPAFVLDDLRQVGSHSEDEPLSLEVTLKSLRLGAPPTAVTLQFSDKGPATRREVIDKQEARYILSWRPRLDEITPEDRDRGTLSLPVTVTLIYQWEGRTVRSSRTIDMQIKLDPDRVRRRLHTGLDLLMGKVPKGLQS